MPEPRRCRLRSRRHLLSPSLQVFPVVEYRAALGHPLGHPKDRVDPRYPYLMDHHIYRDPRFEVKAAVSYNVQSDCLELQTGTLRKYSWNPPLRVKYGVE